MRVVWIRAVSPRLAALLLGAALPLIGWARPAAAQDAPAVKTEIAFDSLTRR